MGLKRHSCLSALCPTKLNQFGSSLCPKPLTTSDQSLVGWGCLPTCNWVSGNGFVADSDNKTCGQVCWKFLRKASSLLSKSCGKRQLLSVPLKSWQQVERAGPAAVIAWRQLTEKQWEGVRKHGQGLCQRRPSDCWLPGQEIQHLSCSSQHEMGFLFLSSQSIPTNKGPFWNLSLSITQSSSSAQPASASIQPCSLDMRPVGRWQLPVK